MKGFILSNFKKTSKGYEIALGNGAFFYFPSEKKAKTFLADTGRFLEEILFQINQSYTEILIIHRRYWMLSDNFQADNELRSELNSVADVLSQAVQFGRMPNKQSWIIPFLEKGIRFLKNAIKYIQAIVNKQRADTFTRHQLNNHIQQLNVIAGKIMTYGHADCDKLVDRLEYAEILANTNLNSTKITKPQLQTA